MRPCWANFFDIRRLVQVIDGTMLFSWRACVDGCVDARAFYVLTPAIGCCPVSGPVDAAIMTAGPDAIRGLVPISFAC